MMGQVRAVEAKSVKAYDRTADVVVVGQGIGGVCAALEAHRAGAQTLILERASGGGGTSATSEGIFYLGGGTAVQRALGYDDTAEELFKFLKASTSAEEGKLRAFAEGSAAHFDWLEAQGVPFERVAFKGKAVSLATEEGGLLTTGNEKVWPYRDMAQPAPRGHQARRRGDQSSGGVAMEALLARCREERIPALYDAQVLALILDGPRVVGVRTRYEGREIDIGARRGVVLATGSFNANADMVAENTPQVSETSLPIGIPYNDGCGMLMGQSAGGALEGMDGIIATASLYPPAQLIKGIVVNALGERFVAEDAYHGRLADFVSEQPGQTAYLIVDSEVFAYPENTRAGHRLVDGWDTVEEMEAGLHLPQGALKATMEAYNRDAREGCDGRFHKHPDWVKPLDKPPYAAFDISFDRSVYAFLTLGGLRTNVHGQVLSAAGRPVPGLYAAGAVAAQLTRNGKEYASGLTLGPGSYFGRLAGRHAALAGAG